MAGGPVASTLTRVARRSSDQGTGGAGAFRPSRLRASLAMGRFFSALTAASRRASEGSLPASASSVRTTSSSVTPISGVAGDDGDGAVSTAGVDRPPGSRPPEAAACVLQAGPRATPAPGVVSLPGHRAPGGGHGQHQRVRIGPWPRARATWSCSWRSNLFCSRPARRCSSTRIDGQGAHGRRRWPRCRHSRPGPGRPASGR